MTAAFGEVSWSMRWPTSGERAAKATSSTTSAGTSRRLPATQSMTSTPMTAAAQARRV